MCVILISKALRFARVNEGSHSFNLPPTHKHAESYMVGV